MRGSVISDECRVTRWRSDGVTNISTDYERHGRAQLLNFYTTSRRNALAGLKDGNVTSTMPIYKAVFDPTTSRWTDGSVRTTP
jgi:hypothetical protein